VPPANRTLAIGLAAGALGLSASPANAEPLRPIVVLVHGAWADAPPGTLDLYLKRDIFVHHFGNDLPQETATRLWATQRTASTAAFDTPATRAAWQTIPSWYFISSGDQIITPTSEQAMAARARSQVTTFDGESHLTLISHPDAVTAVIESAIASVR
jgi:pimeloyl-ACP methyl ester carboxylesterase